MDVLYIFRSQRPGYFSIEKIFIQIASSLKNKATTRSKYVPHSRLLPKNIFQNFKAIRNVSADIYHVTGDVHYLVLGLPRKKTILTIHDSVFLHTTTGIKRWLLKYFFLKKPVQHCSIITTISEKSRNEIIQYSNCPPDKIEVIPNPVGEFFYYSSKPFNESRPVFLFIGSTPNKNLERVSHALEGILADLVIVGEVNAVQKQLLEKNNVSYRSVSNLSEEALADLYASSDVVLFPSTYEGFGLPIIEGQKSGRAVITSNISPMKEVAGEGACLVDPLDVSSIRQGIERVIKDPSYRESIIKAGLENVKQYESSAIAEKYFKVYQRLMEQ